MIVLGLDTALTACSAAVLDGERVLASASEPMTRGHQERLAPMVQHVMAEAGIGFDALDRIGVSIGPGGFTGLRVGLAFAKGLALALGIPCAGVTTLEALAASVLPHGSAYGGGSRIAATIDARREQVYLQLFADGAPVTDPEAAEIGDAFVHMADRPLTLIGSGAALLAPHLPGAQVNPLENPDPVAVARLAAAVTEPVPPRPLYLRAPDARLPS